MANKVIVQPGGNVFTKIQDAIDSIQDASEKCWYQVLCSAGTYEERITLKPWVFVTGMDETTDNTIITCNTTGSPTGTIIAASNSGVTGCTIISMAVKGGDTPCAVFANGVENFKLIGCKVYTKQSVSAHFAAICTVALNFYKYGSGKASMHISSCEISQECQATSTGPSMEAVAADVNATMEVYNSKISCVGASDYAGALVATGGKITVEISDISCPNMALDTASDSSGGSIKAIGCKISGGVGKGVVVVDE